MADGAGQARGKKSKSVAGSITEVNATQLGQHLGVTRQRIANMVTEGIVVRLPSGQFDQDLCRLSYISWLQRDNRRSPRVEADAQYQSTRHELLMLQLMKVRGETMLVTDSIQIFEEMFALYRWQLDALPARLSRDISERRRFKIVCDQLFDELGAEYKKKAKAVRIENAKWLAQNPTYREISPFGSPFGDGSGEDDGS
jgi:phage terminase Nu1 subunit (DNA packaging protein)